MKGEPQFYRKKLSNGLTVLCEERKTPVVVTAVAVKFGAQHESAEHKGVSHFIEHVVFKGTHKKTAKEIPQEIEERGGVINAFTSEELTCFWDKLPKKHCALGADSVIDLACNPLFEKNAIERERNVIVEEIKMYHDNPSSHVIEKIKSLLYAPPFNLPISGTVQSVRSLSREMMLKNYRVAYTPNNMIFMVVGNTNWKSVLDQAKKFPSPSHKEKIYTQKIIPRHGNALEKRKGIDQAHLVMGFHMPTLTHADRYAAEIFDVILGDGMSSRLFQEVREKRGLCYAIKSNLEQSKEYAYELIYAGTTKDKIPLIKKIVGREIKKIKKLSAAELNQAKERLIGLRQIEKERADATMIDLMQEEIAGDAQE
ncbi:MAG: pitrilysin family protein, partial [Nanoarchaeota archaeon]